MPRDRARRGTRGEGHAPGRGNARVLEDRTRIAQVAARLIAEHGIRDWSAAKRKAARQLGLPEGLALPSNEDIEQALTDYHALFGGASHAASLREQRAEALRWMTRLEAWAPVLVGGVAAGWATAHSDVRLELAADDPKAVEMLLVSKGVRYAALPARRDDVSDSDGAELLIDTPAASIRLSIISPVQRRNRPRRADEPRLPRAELEALLSQA